MTVTPRQLLQALQAASDAVHSYREGSLKDPFAIPIGQDLAKVYDAVDKLVGEVKMAKMLHPAGKVCDKCGGTGKLP